MRDELVQVAIDHFGRKGRDGATTREMAAAAGTTMSQITYHFGGKNGLYRAAAEHILLAMTERMGAVTPPPANPPREQRVDFVVAIVLTAARFMLSPESERFARFLAREQDTPSEEVAELVQNHFSHIKDNLVMHVEAVRPQLSKDEARATTFHMLGMAMHLRMGRARLLDIFDVPKVDERIEQIVLKRLEEMVRTLLGEAS